MGRTTRAYATQRSQNVELPLSFLRIETANFGDDALFKTLANRIKSWNLTFN